MGNGKSKGFAVIVLLTVAFSSLALSVTEVAFAQQSSPGWPMFRGNLSHSGMGTGTFVLAAKLLWKYTTGSAAKSNPTEYTHGGPVESSPAVVNGVVYVGCDDTSLYALNAATGSQIWIATASSDPLISSPAVVDGVIYVGSSGQLVGIKDAVHVVAATSTSNLYGSLVNSSPAVVNGTIYYGTYSGTVQALNISRASFGGGAQFVWTYSVGKSVEVNSSPAVVNGVVYIGVEDTYVNQTSVEGVGAINAANGVYALNATDGDQLWNFTDGGYSIDSSPAIINDVVYVGSYDGNVYALNAANGAKLWNYSTGAYVDSSPAVAKGVVYVSSHDGNFYALNASEGAKLWSYPTGGGRSSPAVVDGVVYVGGGDSLYALNATSGAELWSYATGGEVESSPAVGNGAVYVGSDDGRIYAFGATPQPSNTLLIVIGAVIALVIVATIAFVVFRKRVKVKPLSLPAGEKT